MRPIFRILIVTVLLFSAVAWAYPDGPVATFERPYGMHLERYTEGLTTAATGPGQTTVIPPGYYDRDLSHLIPEGVSFYDFLAHYIRWLFPYWYDHFDCTEMSAAIEWLAEGCGYEARVVCNDNHCWAEIQLDGHWRAYESIDLFWVDRNTPRFVFGDIYAMVADAPWPGEQFDWWAYSSSPGSLGPGGWGILGSHTVQAGEHVYAIARAYGVDPAAIQALNGVGDALTIGQVLLIPDAPRLLAAGPTAARQFNIVQAPPSPPPLQPIPVPAPPPMPVPPPPMTVFNPVLPFEVVNPTPSSRWPAQTERWRHLIEPIATKYGLDPDLVAAVMIYESNGQAQAISTMGATGLMQVMPRETGFPSRPTRAQLLDPATNIEWGCKILTDCIARYRSVYTALACYYGFGGVHTARYQAEVWAIYQRYKGA